MNKVVVTGADRNIGLEMCREFLKKGWFVFAGKFLMELSYLDKLQAEYPGQMVIVKLDTASTESIQAAAAEVAKHTKVVDMVVHNAAHFGAQAGEIKGEMDLSRFCVPYNVNALGALRMIQAFQPLMQEGMKRLCFTSSEAGVVSVSHRDAISSYGMSKTALNMALRMAFNLLQPKGYSFRLFHPGWVRSPKIERDDQVVDRPRGGKFEPEESAASAIEQFIADREWEDRLAIIDNEGMAWPF